MIPPRPPHLYNYLIGHFFLICSCSRHSLSHMTVDRSHKSTREVNMAVKSRNDFQLIYSWEKLKFKVERIAFLIFTLKHFLALIGSTNGRDSVELVWWNIAPGVKGLFSPRLKTLMAPFASETYECERAHYSISLLGNPLLCQWKVTSDSHISPVFGLSAKRKIFFRRTSSIAVLSFTLKLCRTIPLKE